MKKIFIIAAFASIIFVYSTKNAEPSIPDMISKLKLKSTLMWYDALCPKNTDDINQLIKNLNKKYLDAKKLHNTIKKDTSKKQKAKLEKIWENIENAYDEKIKLYCQYRTALKNNKKLDCQSDDGTPMLFAPAPPSPEKK
ncbi:hypothetical protein KAH94_04780 [bacterium]|nr:hypothetical protein [bacterium]